MHTFPTITKKLDQICEAMVFKDWTIRRAGQWSIIEGKQTSWIYDFSRFLIEENFQALAQGGGSAESVGEGKPRKLEFAGQNSREGEGKGEEERGGKRASEFSTELSLSL